MYTPPIEQQQNQIIIEELQKLNRAGENAKEVSPEHKVIPPSTEKPPSDATLYAWFDYLYAVRATGRKFTLDQLADTSPFSRSYIGKEHPKYLKSRVNKK